MKQYSIDNSPVELEVLSGHLLFTDPLYFQDIADNYQQVNSTGIKDQKELVKIFEKTFFPYGGGGLLGYKHVDERLGVFVFNPDTLRKWRTKNEAEKKLAASKEIATIGLDTASFLIIDLANLDMLINFITYDGLIDALLSNNLEGYVDRINKQLGNKGWAYVSSQGINAQDEFDGDGSYIF